MKRNALLIPLLLLAALQLNAQRYYSVYSVPDTMQNAKIKTDLAFLDEFVTGNADSLFKMLGSDTSIVHPDTLRKYATLYKRDYSYSQGAGIKNPMKWTQSPGSYTLDRTFAGIPEVDEAHAKLIYHTVLVMHVDFFVSKGKTTVRKISFSVQPPGSEVQTNFLDLRPAKQEEKMRQDLMKKRAKDIPELPR